MVAFRSFAKALKISVLRHVKRRLSVMVSAAYCQQSAGFVSAMKQVVHLVSDRLLCRLRYFTRMFPQMTGGTGRNVRNGRNFISPLMSQMPGL